MHLSTMDQGPIAPVRTRGANSVYEASLQSSAQSPPRAQAVGRAITSSEREIQSMSSNLTARSDYFADRREQGEKNANIGQYK